LPSQFITHDVFHAPDLSIWVKVAPYVRVAIVLYTLLLSCVLLQRPHELTIQRSLVPGSQLPQPVKEILWVEERRLFSYRFILSHA
jgi:hypothetical protein